MPARHFALFLATFLASCGGALNTKGGADSNTDAGPDSAGDVTVEEVDVPGEVVNDPVPDGTPDIGVDVAPDPVEDPVMDPTPVCGTDGALLYGICWYLGDFTENCYTVCSSHGGYDSDTPEYVGTPSQGGSIEECSAILEALGYSGTVSEGYREDGLGLGCHVWRDGGLWWLDSPDFEPGDTAENGQIVCGCNE